MNKKVSIVIPVYNVEKYLERCVDSVLSQTYENIEIILVDDGSTDGSSKICKKYENNPKIKLVTEKNSGLPAARNAGVKASTGDYITYLDSDDYLDKNYIEELVKLSNESTIAACNIRDIFPKKTSLHNRVGIFSKSEYVELVMSDKQAAFVVGYLFESEICKKIAFDEKTRYFEDILYLAKYFNLTKKTNLVSTNDTYYNYFQNPNSITLSREKLTQKIEDLFSSTDAVNKETGKKYEKALLEREIGIFEALLQDADKNTLEDLMKKFDLPDYTGSSKRLKLFANLYQKNNVSGLIRYYKYRKIAKNLILKIR